MSLYVYISEKCEEEAKIYHLEEHLYQLKNRVEQEQHFAQFEVFEYPYQVKKRVGYNYRLLTRLCYVEIQQKKYQVLVFLKLYNRGDKDYSLLYIHAKTRGDFIYQQQNIEPYLHDYVQQRLTQQHVISQYDFSEQDLLYLQYSRINLLNLQQQPTEESYLESPLWRYQIRPFCSTEILNEHYQTLFSALETQQSQQFTIQEKSIEFLKVDDHYQLMQQDEVIHEKSAHYAQHIPLDILLDAQHWSLAQQIDLPFCLNEFQQKCINLMFYQHQNYPLLINAGKNTGKTTLLALLYLHFIQQNYVPESSLPCLFLTSSHEAVYLRQQIQQAIKLQQQWKKLNFLYSDDQLSQLLSSSCLSLNDLILQQFTPQQREKFQSEHYISEMRFNRLWYQHFYEHEEAKKLYSAALCWSVIQYLIKGYSLDQEHEQSAQVVAQLSMISPEIFKKIETLIWKGWYQPLCEAEGYWDDQDLILAAYDADVSLPHYSALLCDQSQNLSRNATQFILQSAIWLKKPVEDHIYDAPLIFIGQHAASYPSSLLPWYREINAVLQQNMCVGNTVGHATIQEDSHAYLTDLDAHFQQKRQALHILKSKIYLEFHADFPSDIEVLFISTQHDAAIRQLLMQHDIPLILNCLAQKQNRYLKSMLPFSSIFKLLTEAQIQQESYCLNHLPKKSHSVAVAGFYHPCFVDVQKNRQLEYLTFSERYHIDYRLNLVQQACQQGLQRIFILGDDTEYEVWQALLSVCEQGQSFSPFQFRPATLFDICPNIEKQQQDLHLLQKQEMTAREKQDSHLLRDIADDYFHAKKFDQYFENLVYAYDIEQKYEEYFLFCQSDEQKERMVLQLWQQQKPHLLLKYQKYFPSTLQANVTALALAHERILSQDYALDLLQIAKQYQCQNIKQVWNDFWHVLLTKILDHLTITVHRVIKNWSVLSDALHILSNLGLMIPYSLKAYCAYGQEDRQGARQLWQNAKDAGEITDFPKEYYTLNLTTTEDVSARLSCFMALRQTDQLMNELNQLNLNELKTEYWQNILEYLHEEDELKPILKQLLPEIQSQEILEKLYRFCKNYTSDKFAVRVQRFKTLQACLNSDWDVVYERLAHYIPIQDEKVAMQKLLLNFSHVSKARARNKKNSHVQFNEELIEMLYALNINPQIYVAENALDFKKYVENEHIAAIFNAIRKNFALENDKEEIVWKINFSAVRSLCYLLEKSPNTLDSLQIYQNIIDRKQKDALFDFSIDRLYCMIQRLKKLENVDEIILKKVGQLEVEHKKLFQSRSSVDTAHNFDLPVIKTQDEIIKSILALSNQENAEIQKREREEALLIEQENQAKKEAELFAEQEREAELKRLFDLAEQQKNRQEAEEHAFALQQSEDVSSIMGTEHTDEVEIEEIENHKEILSNVILEPEKTEELHIDDIDNIASIELAHDIQHISDSVELEMTQQNDKQNISLEDHHSIQAEHSPQQHDMIKNPVVSTTQPLAILQSRKAITEFEFFGARIFVSRTHQRMNIEDIETGERWSLHLKTGKVHSDWALVIQDKNYHLPELRLMVAVDEQQIHLQQLDHGISLSIQF